MLPEKPNHLEAGLSRLKHQRKGKKVIEGLISSYLIPVQDVSDGGEFLKNLSIMNATGEYLELYGRLYNVQRNQRTDSQYRSAILGYVASTQPDASPEGILEAIRSYGQTTQVDLHEHFPCYTQLYMGEGFDPDMYTVLKTLVPAATDVGLYIDNMGDSIVLAEETTEALLFSTQQDKLLDVEYLSGQYKNLAVDNFDGSLSGQSNSIFAEELDTTWFPLAEQMDFGVEYSTGRIIDEFDNYLVDELGNYIIYVDYRFKPK